MSRLQEESIEELRARLAREEAARYGDPTPEEIAERAAEIRRGWCDENGVLLPDVRGGEAAVKGWQTRRAKPAGRKRKPKPK